MTLIQDVYTREGVDSAIFYAEKGDTINLFFSGAGLVHVGYTPAKLFIKDSVVALSGDILAAVTGNSEVSVNDDAVIHAHVGSTVLASENSVVHANLGSNVRAFDSATVYAQDATVRAADNSMVIARGSSTVWARDASQVEAHDTSIVYCTSTNSQVTAFDRAFIKTIEGKELSAYTDIWQNDIEIEYMW